MYFVVQSLSGRDGQEDYKLHKPSVFLEGKSGHWLLLSNDKVGRLKQIVSITHVPFLYTHTSYTHAHTYHTSELLWFRRILYSWDCTFSHPAPHAVRLHTQCVPETLAPSHPRTRDL